MDTKRLVSCKLSLPDATALRQMLDSGEISATELVMEHANRIRATHGHINGASKIFIEKALAQAANPVPGPLSGVPISIKETFGMQGESITCGSKRGRPVICREDSVIVSRLKKAGAIILARSNTPEFSMGPETNNLLVGRTNNPLNLACTSGGSSGGEGALVGSGSTVLGVGSDFGGSIRIPAAFCGIVGFKPHSKAVDKAGTLPESTHFAHSLLGLGPLTRSVRDARLLYDIIAEKPLPAPPLLSFGKLQIFGAPGYYRKLKEGSVPAALQAAYGLCTSSGMQTKSVDFSETGRLFADFNQIMASAFEMPIHEALSGRRGQKIGLTRECWHQISGRPTIHPWLFQLLLAFPLLRPSPARLCTIIERTERSRAYYFNLLGETGIMILPTVGQLAPKHGGLIAKSRTPGVPVPLQPAVFCNMLDLPAITLPAWKYRSPGSGLVPGIMLICRPGNEALLFQVAEWLEAKI